jgi:hypothetical protein
MVPNHQPVIVFWSCFFKYSDPSKVIIAAGKNHLWSPGEAAQRCHHFAPSGAAKVWRPQFLGPSWMCWIASKLHTTPCCFTDEKRFRRPSWYHHIRKLKLPKVTKIQYMTCGAKYSLFHFFLIEASTYLPIWVWANTWNSAKHNCYSNSMAISGS